MKLARRACLERNISRCPDFICLDMSSAHRKTRLARLSRGSVPAAAPAAPRRAGHTGHAEGKAGSEKTPPLFVVCVTVVRQTRRVGKVARQRLPTASLAKFTKPNAAMPTHADSTHPTIQPLRYTTPPGLFGVYMRSSALAYFRQHGASDYHQTATRVSTSRTFYQQIPTVVYGRSGATTRPLSHNGPHTYT